MLKHTLILFLSLSFFFQNCTSINTPKEDDKLLAKVYNKSLFLSDMAGMFPDGMTSEDSSLIIDAYVNRWIKDAVLMHEAERNFPKDLDIDKLVRDYRASLIRLNYEQTMVEQSLDSTITDEQLNEFYESNKAQYQLETPIMKCLFIKIPKETPDLNKVQLWWNSKEESDFEKLKVFCENNATVFQLDTVWQEVKDIATYMPLGTLTIDNVNSKREFTQRDDEFYYFFRLIELVSKKEIAPLSYIKGQASKVILHKRKLSILEDMKQKMYEEALRKNNVEIY